MDEKKDGSDNSGMSRDNKLEYNSLVTAYQAVHQATPDDQVLQETKAIWQSLKDLFVIQQILIQNVFFFNFNSSEFYDVKFDCCLSCNDKISAF